MIALLRQWRARWKALANAGVDEPLTGPRLWLVWALSAWDEVRRNHLTLHASALAFWLLLSIVPALALLFAILKAFRLAEAARPVLLNALTAGQGDLVEWIAHTVEQAQGAMLGGAGILSLLAAGFAVLLRLKRALNEIWNVEETPGVASRVIEYATVLALAPLLTLAPVMASAALHSPLVDELLQVWPAASSLRLMAAESAGYPVYWLLLFYAYAFLPDARVGWRSALLGAVVAGTLLNAGQTIYLRTVYRITDYNVIYGALALLPFLMLWLFLGAVIFLFGAQLAYVSQHHAFLVGRRRLGREKPSARAVLALRGLVALFAAYRESAAPVALAHWARTLNVPESTAQAVAANLRHAGLVAAVEGPHPAFLPALPPETVTAGEALRRLGALPVFPVLENGEVLRGLLREADAVLESKLDEALLERLAGAEPK